MEEDYKGIADARVGKFLKFIRKFRDDKERKIIEDGKKEEEY
jgi:hypothetical protein